MDIDARDGVHVPLTLLQARNRGPPGPVLLEVYGAYGQPLEADFRPHRLALLRRGWAVALAHVRGGGELGRRWHAAGRGAAKGASVSDLLACATALLDMGVAAPGRIAGHAVSAGGLTLAAAAASSPELFSALILEAPLADWAGALASPAGMAHALAAHEMDEWGDPASDAAVAALVAELCPASRAARGALDGAAHPGALVTAGLCDGRVPYWIPLKYVAALRHALAAAQPGEQQLSLIPI